MLVTKFLCPYLVISQNRRWCPQSYHMLIVLAFLLATGNKSDDFFLTSEIFYFYYYKYSDYCYTPKNSIFKISAQIFGTYGKKLGFKSTKTFRRKICKFSKTYEYFFNLRKYFVRKLKILSVSQKLWTFLLFFVSRKKFVTFMKILEIFTLYGFLINAFFRNFVRYT